jgi:hypothetical protein
MWNRTYGRLVAELAAVEAVANADLAGLIGRLNGRLRSRAASKR